MMTKELHKPVMYKEVLEYLNLRPGMTILDATLGTGAHALGMIKKIIPEGRLIGIDKDKESLEIARKNLFEFNGHIDLIHQDFRKLDMALDGLGVKYLDGALFDLGLSSYQMDTRDRGFSIKQEGPLDMRMDREGYISAYDLVNNLSIKEIDSILWNFGQERWHRRIASSIVRERTNNPIATTTQLSKVIARSVPNYVRHQKIHPATRAFQAFRIAVNRELESLDIGLLKLIDYLKAKARVCVISFHSLEDRIVKNIFRENYKTHTLKIITPKPQRPQQEEVVLNLRSRSAKLRVAERL